MAFDSLSEKLQNVFKNLRGKGRLTEADVKAALKDVKLALLEADVSFKVVKQFIKAVEARAVGTDVMESLTPGQMVIKIVNEEMVNLMGSETTEIKLRPSNEITVIMMTGLQGAGKTTTAAKLAGKFKIKGRKVLLTACDVYRPAAIKQLQVNGEKQGVEVFSMGDQHKPVDIAKAAMEHAKKQGMSVDELRKSMKTNMLRQRVMGAEVGRRVVVTDDEIRAYYEKHKDTMYDRNGLHMGLIVYNPNVNARSIAAQIASGALSFEEAARKYSIAPNREKGGDMGPVEWGRLNPEWETRLNKMKPGDVTDIFTVQGHKAQVHLFPPGQSGPGRPMTFEEARPVIDNILRQPKAMERFDEYSQQLRSKAVIDIRL